MPHFKFNKELWDAGRKIEDDALPKLNKYFKTNFKRNENDIFDILDFKDEEEKIIVEVKGRFNRSDKYKDTIITPSKVMAGQQAIDEGYKVYFLFVFTNFLFFCFAYVFECCYGSSFLCELFFVSFCFFGVT